jgi:hypothetical protein
MKIEEYTPEKPLVVPVYSDNGSFSHWTLLEFGTGKKLWSEDPNECKAMGYPIETCKHDWYGINQCYSKCRKCGIIEE